MSLSLHPKMSVNRASTERQQSVNRVSTEHQQRVNYLGCWLMDNLRAMHRFLPIIEVLAAVVGNMVNIAVATPENEHQLSVKAFGWCILDNPRAMLRLLPIIDILGAFVGNMVNVAVAIPKNERQQTVNRPSTESQLSVNRAWTILGHSNKLSGK